MAGTNQNRLDFDQIQGLVFSGYPKCASACYVLLRVQDAAKARHWLRILAPRVTFGETNDPSSALNVALTSSGLKAIGLDKGALETFPLEFQEGLAQDDDAYRPRILGDVGGSAPSGWSWGSPEKRVDLVLMLFAPDDAELERQLEEHRRTFSGALSEAHLIWTANLPERREHFGFVDGIAQPKIQGQTGGSKQDVVRPGEFILGYENEFEKIPNSPAARGSDLGKNGTFMVVRQLEQDVEAFWQSMAYYAREASGEDDKARAEWLAAKCIGRWPNGAPLMLASDSDEPKFNNENTFMYKEDPDGLKCPIGAHIRRSNPRDSLEPDEQASLKATNRRRILRRGRAYGPPLERYAKETIRKERGLVFICLNTNIRRQFEFVQQSWINNDKFDGLNQDQDPIVGDQKPGERSVFTIPHHPLRFRLPGLRRFVHVRGGAYFFLPSRAALEFLSKLESETHAPRIASTAAVAPSMLNRGAT
jgi:Dyp-type peroxidase family